MDDNSKLVEKKTAKALLPDVPSIYSTQYVLYRSSNDVMICLIKKVGSCTHIIWDIAFLSQSSFFIWRVGGMWGTRSMISHHSTYFSLEHFVVIAVYLCTAWHGTMPPRISRLSQSQEEGEAQQQGQSHASIASPMSHPGCDFQATPLIICSRPSPGCSSRDAPMTTATDPA